MSAIRALSTELPTRSDDDLLWLFAARPDLIDPPATDFASLAGRAASRISLQRALDRLDTPHIQVLEAILVHGGTITATDLLPLIGGSDPGTLGRILEELNRLALLYRDDSSQSSSQSPPSAHPGSWPGYAPVSSLYEVMGQHLAGLGRPYSMLQAVSSDWMQDTVLRLGLAGTDPASALATHVPGQLSSLLDGAPPQTRDVLNQFTKGPIGILPGPRQGHHGNDEASRFLINAGVLVPLDDRHVELPREIGLELRSRRVIEHLSLGVPLAPEQHITPKQRDHAALSVISELLRETGLALEAIAQSPVPTLRSGGVGIHATRSLAGQMNVETSRAGFLLELMSAAALITLNPDTSSWQLSEAGALWHELDRSQQWLQFGQAWLGLDRAIALIGEPLASGQKSPGQKNPGPAIRPLSMEARRPDLPRLRELLFSQLLKAAESSGGPGASEVPVFAPEDLCRAANWLRPRLWRRTGHLASGVLQEAAELGFTGAGALTDHARELLEGEPGTARDLLAAALPAPVDKILLQHDLTAVAPGFLEPRFAAELARMADREGRGPAVIFRFTEKSIQRALRAGREPEQLLGFLARNSSTAIPQALEYLIQDAAARHGAVRISVAGSVLTVTDETMRAMLLHDPSFEPLGFRQLSPEVLSSPKPPHEVAQRLQDQGMAPLLEQEPQTTAARQLSSSSLPVLPALGKSQPAQDSRLPAEQLRLLRTRHSRARVSGESPADPSPEGLDRLSLSQLSLSQLAPQLTVEALHEAVRSRAPVTMTTVDASGNPERGTYVVLSVTGGRARVYDPQQEVERVVSLHRITEVAQAEGKQR